MNGTGHEFLKQLYTYSGVLNVLTCSVIIPLVLSRNRTRVATTFSLFIATLGVWSLVYMIWVHQQTIAGSEFWVRAVMIPVTFMPSTFLHFVSEITQRRIRPQLHAVNYLLSLAFTSVVYHPWFAPYGGPSYLLFKVWPVAGPLFYLHFLHFGLNFAYGYVVLFLIARFGQEPLRSRIIPVFWGTFIGVITGSINFLPWFQIYVPPVFPPCITLVVLMFAYAIIRHQLMDIQVVIKRTLVFAGLVGAVGIMVSLVAFVSQEVVARAVQVPRWLSNVMTASLIAVLYGPIHTWLVNTTDRYLFQKKYDYKELLKKFAEDVIGIINLQQLVEQTARTLTETIKLESCQLLLLNESTGRYESATTGGEQPSVQFESQGVLVRFLREQAQPIWTDAGLGPSAFPDEAVTQLTQLGLRLCLPLFVNQELRGVLCFGKKKSDAEFTRDDLDILLPLGRTLAIALANATLYDRVQRLNTELTALNTQLEQKVQARTAELEGANQQLAEADRAKTQFLASISHELRTPLNAIIGFSALLLKQVDGPLTSRQHEDLGAISRSGTHLLGLISDLLDLSKIAAGKMELNWDTVDLGDMIRGVLTTAQALIQQKPLEIRAVIDPRMPKLRGDPLRLRQVLLNLVSNAVKFTDRGEVEVQAQRRGAYVIVTVRDTGDGIRPNDQAKLFQEFRRVDGGRREGTGLGLAISKRLIQLHGGEIWVESILGEGSTFGFSLPVEQKPAPTVVPAQASPANGRPARN